MKFKLPKLIAAAAFALCATGAQAVTVYYSDFITGSTLGPQTVAVLDATDTAAGVMFELTNTVDGAPGAHIKQLGLTYSGTALSFPTSLSVVGTSEAIITGFGTGGLNGGGPSAGSFNFGIQFTNAAGIGRLDVGETASFMLLGTTLAEFDFDDMMSRLHIGGYGGSSKYNAGECLTDCGPSSVPLPAGAPLLLLGLGGLAALKRKRTV
ncbi:VPLPA-CTERM sorting domain-containing protein [Aliiroseovarius sp. PTFE2010]|uniref:VPLPA-CTERM sorting domain-containing protein n=1 Tax=Aliiroseovarius sp. PTFE2010 TaxID=3417190 RepID=UPI003CF236DA